MSKHQNQETVELLSWDTKYNGSAIYALVGSEGIRYIGRAIHLQHRLKAHRNAFRKILNATDEQAKNTYLHEGKKLVEAIRSGVTFRAKVLKKFPEVYQASRNDLILWENYYINRFGGPKRTYNADPSGNINDYYEPDCYPITWDEYELIEELHPGIHKMPKRKRPFVLTILLDDDGDADIIEKLNQVPQAQKTYIKELIKADIRK